jgi:hypothetical protein
MRRIRISFSGALNIILPAIRENDHAVVTVVSSGPESKRAARESRPSDFGQTESGLD